MYGKNGKFNLQKSFKKTVIEQTKHLKPYRSSAVLFEENVIVNVFIAFKYSTKPLGIWNLFISGVCARNLMDELSERQNVEFWTHSPLIQRQILGRLSYSGFMRWPNRKPTFADVPSLLLYQLLPFFCSFLLLEMSVFLFLSALACLWVSVYCPYVQANSAFFLLFLTELLLKYSSG